MRRFFSKLSGQRVHHIISDIHLEHRSNVNSLKQLQREFPQLIPRKFRATTPQTIDPKFFEMSPVDPRDILLLPGDIGNPRKDNYWQFLRSCTDDYAHVIFTTGNHEYYHDFAERGTEPTICEVDQMIQEGVSKIPRLHYLQRSRIDINGVRYLGTTLWSRVSDLSLEERSGDYRYIWSTKGKNITVPEIRTLWEANNEWLKSQIVPYLSPTSAENKELSTRTVVVLTHHLPIRELIHSKYLEADNPEQKARREILSTAFYSPMNYLARPGLRLWAAGHTHTPMNLSIGTGSQGTQYIVRPLGLGRECWNAELGEVEI